MYNSLFYLYISSCGSLYIPPSCACIYLGLWPCINTSAIDNMYIFIFSSPSLHSLRSRRHHDIFFNFFRPCSSVEMSGAFQWHQLLWLGPSHAWSSSLGVSHGRASLPAFSHDSYSACDSEADYRWYEGETSCKLWWPFVWLLMNLSFTHTWLGLMRYSDWCGFCSHYGGSGVEEG
jgi:hypothetical protein